MKFFRNAEIKAAMLIYIVTSVVAVSISFAADNRFGFIMLGVCIVFIAVYLISTGIRYKRISELSGDIDRILHGDEQVSLDRYSEGELSVLQCEVHKMMIRLREQQHRLQNDKIYLADSIADISHQIRTPLTSINLLVQLLSESDLSEERRLGLTRELSELLSRIDWLITALLKISKLDTGTVRLKKESIFLSELIAKATAPLLVPIELRGQNLTVNACGDFVGDISWTCEAVGNIIKNCMEHTPFGGEIAITASENALYSEIIISDTGSGIAKEDLPNIFDRFYKGKNSDDKSFGIGLALARMIITSQNGTVKAENKPINGAVFTVRFYKGTV